MENTEKTKAGKRSAGMSKNQKIRLAVNCVLVAILLALIITLVVFVVDIFTAPKISQPDRPIGPNDSSSMDPGDTDNPGSNGGSDSNKDPEVDKNELKSDFYTFLLAGTCDDYNTDTIMLGAVNTKTLECNIISIPRDTMYDTTAKIKRINGAYGRGGSKGADNLREAVRSVTGIYPQYYCIVNMDAFIDVVDEIGGVYFDVPRDMYHEDADPKYHIDLKKGYQHLNGKEALQLVRFRSYKGQDDFGRINMQKEFLVTVLQTVKDKFGVKNATGIINSVASNVKTNMPVADMLWFYKEVISKMDLQNSITFHTMPCTTGKYKGQDYVYLKEQESLELLNQTVNPFVVELSPADVNIICLMDEEN